MKVDKGKCWKCPDRQEHIGNKKQRVQRCYGHRNKFGKPIILKTAGSDKSFIIPYEKCTGVDPQVVQG